VTIPPGGLRLRAAATGVAFVMGIGVTLSACGNGGQALAEQACTHIDRSISLLRQSSRPAGSTHSAQLEQEAYVELRKALPLTAEAAYDNAQWQALMTTVSESNRVPETTLIPALQAQCTDANASQSPFGGQAPPSSSIPPPAPSNS
jgi:hypothetical protein